MRGNKLHQIFRVSAITRLIFNIFTSQLIQLGQKAEQCKILLWQNGVNCRTKFIRIVNVIWNYAMTAKFRTKNRQWIRANFNNAMTSVQATLHFVKRHLHCAWVQRDFSQKHSCWVNRLVIDSEEDDKHWRHQGITSKGTEIRSGTLGVRG